MKNTPHLYVLFPESNHDDCVRNLSQVLEYFDYEIFELFYDLRNIQAFVSQCKDEYPSKNSALHEFLKEKGEEIYFEGIQNFYTEEKQRLLDYIGTKVLIDNNYNFILFNFVNNSTCYLNSYTGKNVKIDNIEADVKIVHNWFSENRVPERIYNHNTKHGEFGKGHWPNASPLLCSRIEAEQLLKKAIGFRDKRHLFYYDSQYQSYIEFRFDNTQINSFHAFHNELCLKICNKIDVVLAK